MLKPFGLLKKVFKPVNKVVKGVHKGVTGAVKGVAGGVHKTLKKLPGPKPPGFGKMKPQQSRLAPKNAKFAKQAPPE